MEVRCTSGSVTGVATKIPGEGRGELDFTTNTAVNQHCQSANRRTAVVIFQW